MSEFHVRVVEIGKIGKHPNADTLSISDIEGYPVIFRSGEFSPGDLATYIPVDSMVPAKREEFAFLTDSIDKQYVRVKAKKLRGIFSMGLLIKAPPNSKLGDGVQDYYGITKYEPIDLQASGTAEKDPGIMPKYTDIEGLRKYKRLLNEGEIVVLTEKLHGENARYVHDEERLWCGSHYQVKKDDPKSRFWNIARKYNLEEKLKNYPYLAIYGEIYGGVQKHFFYDFDKGQSIPWKLRIFDIMNLDNQRYLDYDNFKAIAKILNLETVPELYRGPWSEELMLSHSSGNSILNSETIREGFVVKPIIERYHPRYGRTILKMVGEQYLLSKLS